MDNAGRRDRRRADDKPEPEDPPWWAVGLGVAAGVAALAGGIYMLSKAAEDQSQTEAAEGHSSEEESDPVISMDSINDAVSRMAISTRPKVNNLNSLLSDIHAGYVALKREEFEYHYNVFMKVFYPLHEAMKSVDAYYAQYSSRAQFAGSHYDRLRIKKPDEFDMDIVIGLPVNFREDPQNPDESDIIIEPKHPGFVQFRAGRQYLKILERDNFEVNKQAFLWLDERKYILRSKFISWFRSVVDRALNKFQRSNGYQGVEIDGVVYKINVSPSGPAYTLLITDSDEFKLDVDLVPALRFPEERWLGSSKTYRDIPARCSAGYWMVVPKPNKFGANSFDKNRSWRVAMHDQERKYIHNSYHLRQANRLLKKLRDAQQMKYISSYYIKTLFLWKIFELNQPSFWQRDVATIFKVMLRELHNALVDKKIRYFWNKKHNMIENVPEHILKGYANKLATLVTKLEDDCNYMWAAKYLLTRSEYTEYERILGLVHNSDFKTVSSY